MHESIPTDSNLATRLASGYYTAAPPRDKFTGTKPDKPESADEVAWEAYFDLREAFSNARRDWYAAGEAAYLAACVAQREDRQKEFRTDLVAALGLQQHPAAFPLVLEAEDVAKESAATYASGRDVDYDSDAPMNRGDLDYTADIAARFAAFLKG